ncbi:MAG: hypothetical protein IH940_07295, partial [Acidobacteria bacterium]|nr:hypothetical protein [Acidobacteriota bacterium]
MSATSSARPENLFHYSEINEEQRGRLISRLVEVGGAFDHARSSCSPTYSALWELPGHVINSLG